LIAEPLSLSKYIERMGTGIHDMIERCRETGLPEPEFHDLGERYISPTDMLKDRNGLSAALSPQGKLFENDHS